MSCTRILTLYGTPAARELAKLTLEDQPQVRRIDVSPDLCELRLLLSPALSESALLALLSKCGISGFRLYD